MNSTTVSRIETAVDGLAALALGGASGFATAVVAASLDPSAVGVGVFVLLFAVLRAVPAASPRLTLARFDIAPIGNHLFDAHDDDDDVLLLEDSLPPPDPDSRVVQLFDTARQSAGADGSVGGLAQSTRLEPPVPDASEALSEALRDLRRSLS
jgi:hypothetical protein